MASELQDIPGEQAVPSEQDAANAPAIELALMEDEHELTSDPSIEVNGSRQLDNETVTAADAETGQEKKDTENVPPEDMPGEIKPQTDHNSDDREENSANIQEDSETDQKKAGVIFADPNEREAKEESQTSLEVVDPKPTAGILKKSNYVVAEKDDAVDTSQAGTEKHTERKDGKKSVYIWQLFRYADFWDILMILVGVVMAIISGVALPGHMLLFGQVINQFVYYSTAANTTSSSFSANQSCEASISFIISDRQLLASISQGASSHFCSNSSSGVDVVIGILGYVCDPPGTLFREVGLYSIYYVALATGLLIVTFLATLVWNVSAYRQSRRMRTAFFRSILRQDIGWFDVKGVSELSTRLADDVEKVQAGIGDKISVFLRSISTFIAGYVIGFITNWKLALVIAAMLPVLAFMAAFIAKIIAIFTVREQAAYAAAGGVAEEVLSSIRTVVAFGGEQKETERYGEKLKLARKEGYRKGFFSSLVVGGLYFVIFCTYALGFWYGSTLIVACELAAGDVITVFFAVIIGSFSLGNALPEMETFATALGSASVLFEIIDREPEIDWTSDEGKTLEHLEGNIKFSDVVFSYPARPDVQILNGIDLEINKGQTVAFVGPSGCGKSTTIQLLQRFYNPLAGQITLDGREIRTLNLRWLRNHIGVVSQEPVLFNTTISENIRYGREDATMEDIIQAAKNANAHDFISKLPDGYDTHVGERGAQLSGGQKQRIAIARALVRDPKILLLDEATSALDNESERIVQQALDKAREGRTTIVIAHRLSTIRTANVIVALSRGCVVELGTHDQLMEQKGLYYELVTAQTIDEHKEKQEPLAEFREAVRRTISQRKQSITSRSISKFQRKSSIASPLSKSPEKKPSLSEIPSRFSIADIPIGGAFGAFSGRSTFPGPVDVLDSKEYEDDDKSVFEPEEPTSEEVVAVETRRKTSMLDRKHENVPDVSYLQLLKLNKPDWILVVIGVFFSAVIGCLFPVISILFSEVLRVFGLDDPQEIKDGAARLAGGFVGMAAGAGVVYFIANFTLSIAGERLTKRLRYLSFKAMLRQEIGWFDKKVNSTGALTTRLASDTSDVKGATGIRFGTILQAAVGFIAAIVVAFTGSWELTLLLILAFPILGVAGFFQVRLLSGRAQKNKKRLEEAGQVAVESVDNIRSVAGLGLEHRFYSKYDQLLKGPFKNNIKNVFVQALVIALGESLVFYIYAAGYIFGAYLVKENRAAYEDIFLVFGAIVFTAMSIGRATSFAPDASKAQTSAARILALINRVPPIDTSSSEGLEMENSQCKGDITATEVHFHYPTRPEVKILQGLCVSVKPGQTLALVGPSGCGKSTIVSLVERFYDPVNGNVTLEGKDLRELNLSWLRRQIGIVSQEPVLFDASIAENIRYGALYREVSDQEVIEATKSANIHSFIESLPQGYNTNVGAKGTQLSGGQKQRIAIARAMVRDPKILLLDEATSALDTESEKIVQEALDKARKGRTSIAIAHRLSTIYNSDVIAVIHDGKVIESGTHSQLMAKKEAYYHLNTAQFDENTD